MTDAHPLEVAESAIGGELLSTSVKKLLLARSIRGHYKAGDESSI
uniref:Uncharacterized protein n=1 Tax=uncultured Nocardioidaceae bacterium TaxID=253824 RepID=A0A6J4M2V8_9ACTN|nr:MAG: hypothetical protein AVDCRST_MAG46-2208 [uncultured Nocardioidaceae bacterium]